MNALILSALGLREGTWPPDYYTLLGVDPANLSPEDVETAVLDRMERLRGYQLAHPEPVTEAMNLLARALEALADPAARARYDAERGHVVKPYTPPPPPEPVYLVQPDVPKPYRPIAPIVLATPHAPRRMSAGDPNARRRFRKVVFARRLLAAWDAAGPFLAVPSYQPPSRLAAVEIIGALRRISELTGDEPEELPGGAVLALARSPVTSQMLLEMSDARRGLLSEEWRTGRRDLRSAYASARRFVGRHSIKDRLRRWSNRAGERLPKAIALSAAFLACMIALYRWLI